MLPGWAVVTTRPSAEAIAVANLVRSGYEVFYPKQVRRIRQDGKRVCIMAPLFPGYFFAFLERYCSSFLDIRGVSGLLKINGNVAVVRDEALKDLRAQCNANGLYQKPAKKDLTAGQSVRAVWGIFAEQVGIFEGTRSQQDVALFNVLGLQARVLFKQGNLVPVV